MTEGFRERESEREVEHCVSVHSTQTCTGREEMFYHTHLGRYPKHKFLTYVNNTFVTSAKYRMLRPFIVPVIQVTLIYLFVGPAMFW